jgi:Transposase and inactivated derivatives
MRKTIFSNNEYYHVYNRGTDKRRIFLCEADYRRFIDGMRFFNTLTPVGHLNRNVEASPRQEDVLVKIVAYCLMSNHFHLLLQQVNKNGLSKYLHRLLTGYTMYFNKRYDRVGVLFQGVFKSKHIKDDSYLLHLTRYIHLNPLEKLSSHNPDRNKINLFIKNYKWSSYSAYVQNKNIESVISGEEIILGQFKNRKYYQNFVLGITGKDPLSRLRLDGENEDIFGK